MHFICIEFNPLKTNEIGPAWDLPSGRGCAPSRRRRFAALLTTLSSMSHGVIGSSRSSQPLGLLKKEIMKITAGRKIAYVVDCIFSDANVEKIGRLAKDADILFIEATFLDADATLAETRRHLTARQAGTIARLAGVKRLVTMHYSPRYKTEPLPFPRQNGLGKRCHQPFRGGSGTIIDTRSRYSM
jgi:ribonuclease BN (tRNA processing enzyme)